MSSMNQCMPSLKLTDIPKTTSRVMSVSAWCGALVPRRAQCLGERIEILPRDSCNVFATWGGAALLSQRCAVYAPPLLNLVASSPQVPTAVSKKDGSTVLTHDLFTNNVLYLEVGG